MFINLSGQQKDGVSVIKRTTTIEEIVQFLDYVSKMQVRVDMTPSKPVE